MDKITTPPTEIHVDTVTGTTARALLSEWTRPVPTFESADRDPFLATCPAWCERIDEGHEFQASDEDRSHWTVDCDVPLQLETAQVYSRPGEPFAFQLETAHAGLLQRHGDRQPHVGITLGDNYLMNLTPAEADSFGRLLVQLAALTGCVPTTREAP